MNATCTIGACDRPVTAKGMCKSHRRRWERHGEAMDRSLIASTAPLRTCSMLDCSKPAEGHGLCVKHLARKRANGDPRIVKVDWNTERRFRSKYVVDARGCWIWQGKDVNQVGHARWVVRGRRIGVHVWSYQRFIGPIPDGLVIDHLCRIPKCVNPAHLEPVTQAENVRRAPTAVTTINAAKSYCIHGHPLFGPNLGIGQNLGRPRRYCRICKLAAKHRRRARLRASS